MSYNNVLKLFTSKFSDRIIGNGRIAASKISCRGVRSIVKRQLTDSPLTLKGKVKTEYDYKMDEDFTTIDDIKDLKRMVRQIFVNTDETQTEAEYDIEEDYEAPFEHLEKFHDMNVEEEKQYKSMVKKKIITKKYFKEPRETNLLTYAAKMQIRSLHKLDPIEWNPENLAECFPISVTGVKRLLKNNYEQKNEEKIRQHDADVAEKWRMLESGDAKSLSPVTQQLYLEGKINKDHYAGNLNIPSPVPQKKMLPESKPKKIGEHGAMIQYYIDLKKKAETKEITAEMKTIDVNQKVANKIDANQNMVKIDLSYSESKAVQKSVLPDMTSVYPTRREMESMKCASYLATENPSPNEIEIQQSQFEENLLEEFSEKQNKSEVDAVYEKWVEDQVAEKFKDQRATPEPFDPKDFFESVKKFNNDAIELKTEGNSAYLFDENLGYQQTYGKVIIKRRIKIPEEKHIKGAVYRVGKAFYADDGEFLYRVFV